MVVVVVLEKEQRGRRRAKDSNAEIEEAERKSLGAKKQTIAFR